MNQSQDQAGRKMPDDAYRQHLEKIIAELEGWRGTLSGCAVSHVEQGGAFWRLQVQPDMRGAAPFELVLQADQTFSLRVDNEVYKDKLIDDIALFGKLARAIEAGRVEKRDIRSAVTGQLERVEICIELGDGWNWIGERRLDTGYPRRLAHGEVTKTTRFLPYRR